MFQIKLNDQLKRHIEELKKGNANNSELDEILETDYISMESLIKLYEERWQNRIPLSQLLKPLNFQFKPKRIPRSNYKPEFKKYLEHLKLQQEEKDYQQLIRSDAGLSTYQDEEKPVTPAQINRELKEQVTTVFNILVSVISVSFAFWYWSGSSSGMALHYRVLISLFFGILVLIAEVVVYNSYLQRISDARAKEKVKTEKTKVVKRIVI
ncbi:hypothetical protein ZYGR_0AV01070 [Zygosaccharomyces rouxii]|uniref:Vacuolar ATPase assembly integral membrane protein VPH2 n=1 Tax=Zygosaccharomyces rouxii TaxID=4956 RepID=A0A1Q3AID4_ZYGRO|nr:hypothetical protein ZYGR_0AV01070 [Zygosaccharomyces rouxii]